jgi:hypothetical protein
MARIGKNEPFLQRKSAAGQTLNAGSRFSNNQIRITRRLAVSLSLDFFIRGIREIRGQIRIHSPLDIPLRFDKRYRQSH